MNHVDHGNHFDHVVDLVDHVDHVDLVDLVYLVDHVDRSEEEAQLGLHPQLAPQVLLSAALLPQEAGQVHVPPSPPSPFPNPSTA